MAARTPAKGHTGKHTASKHRATAKHHPSKTKKSAAGAPAPKVHTVAHHAKPAKPRGCAAGDLLPVCVFEALAMSLRLAGQLVDDDEIVALWGLAGSSPLGASLPGALNTARVHGLAGFRPQAQRLKRLVPVNLADHLALPFTDDEAVSVDPFEDVLAGDAHALILGVDLPGPHAVLATPDGWWSWGSLWSPWPARVEEAWAVSWS